MVTIRCSRAALDLLLGNGDRFEPEETENMNSGVLAYTSLCVGESVEEVEVWIPNDDDKEEKKKRRRHVIL